MPENIQAVIYARFSSSGQREESIEGQLRECRSYAQRRGYVIVGEYADRALSGTTDRRPDFQRMIHDAQKGQFSVVICWKHDRFARNRYDAALYKARLKQAGVFLEYAMESVPEGPEGIILESVMEGYAEYYSANLSQNVKRGFYDSASKRLTMGQICYGLKKGENGRFALHPEQAPIVKRIFQEYAAGRAAVDIYTDLNNEGYRTRTGKPFNKNSIRKIISNEKYKGVYVYADIYDESGIPPIVSAELWEAAQVEKKKHREAPALKRVEGGYLLSGKLYCGHCQELMTAGGGTSKTGRKYFYYVCNGQRNKNGCKKKPVDKQYIEDAVVNTLVEIVHSDEVIQTFADRFMIWQDKRTAASGIPTMEKRITEIETALRNLSKAIENGLYSQTLDARVRELEQEREDVQRGIGKALLDEPKLSRQEVVWFLEQFRDGDVDDMSWRIFLVDTFLQAAYLYDDGRLLLQLNYSGDNSRLGVDLLSEAFDQGDNVKCSNFALSSPPLGICTNTRQSEFVLFLLYKCFGVCIPITDLLTKPPIPTVWQSQKRDENGNFTKQRNRHFERNPEVPLLFV